MKERWSRILSLLLLTGAVSLAAAAPTPAREGFAIGAELIFNDIDGPVNSGKAITPGNGLGIRGEYGITGMIAVEASVWRTEHDVQNSSSISATGAELNVKLALPQTGSPIEPYLFGGAGAYRIGPQKGMGWQTGIGMDISLTRHWNVAVEVTRHSIDFDTPPASSGNVTSLGIATYYRIP